MSIPRAIALLCFGLLLTAAGVAHAQQPAEKVSVERAIRAVEKPGGDFGGRTLPNMPPAMLQSQLRWMGLQYSLRYRYEPAHAEAWLTLLRDEKRSIYARLIAAFYLLDEQEEARKFIAAQVKSQDPRIRYNAAQMLQRYYVGSAPKKMWGIDVLLAALADGSLDGGGVRDDLPGNYPEDDRDDIALTPIDDICRPIGRFNPPEAVPTLIAVLKRRPDTRGAVHALDSIGDRRAIPVLMELLVDGKGDKEAVVHALARFKHQEAVPIVIERLGHPHSPDSDLLEALLVFGDKRAVEPIEKYLAGDHSDESKSVARRVLVQLRSPDPVDELIKLLDRETEWLARSNLIDALAKHHDPRVVTKFTEIARTSDFADMRQGAINGLYKLGDRGALLALASLLDEQWPANLKERFFGKGEPKTDYTKLFPDLVLNNLKFATKQDFGRDRKKWEAWIEQNVAEGKPVPEVKAAP